MEPTLQDLDNVCMVTMDNYTEMRIEYGICLGRNLKVVLPREKLVEMSLLPYELYRTIINFYIDHFKCIGAVMIRQANEMENDNLLMISISILEGHETEVNLAFFESLIDSDYQTRSEKENNVFYTTYSALLKKGICKKTQIPNLRKGVEKLLNNYFDFMHSIEFESRICERLLENPFVSYDDKFTVVHTEDDKYGVTAARRNYIQGSTRKDIAKFFIKVKKILKSSCNNAYKNNQSSVIINDNEILVFDEDSENFIHIIPKPEYKLIDILLSYLE